MYILLDFDIYNILNFIFEDVSERGVRDGLILRKL